MLKNEVILCFKEDGHGPYRSHNSVRKTTQVHQRYDRYERQDHTQRDIGTQEAQVPVAIHSWSL